MKAKLHQLALAFLLTLTLHAAADTHYVDLNNPNPAPPYTGWFTAATNIQDAIDAAVDGDLVMVANGTYQTGGRIVYGLLTNRVVINKAIMVQSANGPELTIIQGYQIQTGDTNYNRNIRCVYMTNGAVLNGFTITGGATYALGSLNAQLSGGGVYCESTSAILTNCILKSNMCVSQFPSSGGGAVYRGTLNNCTLANNLVPTNSANYGVSGGGAFQSALNGCLIVSNSASFGGGAANSTLNDSVVKDNRAPFYGSTSFGGGIYHSPATNCLITGNFSGTHGGGAEGGPLDHCILSNNTCAGFGGGSFASALYNCLVASNSASRGGGVYLAAGTIAHCTIAGNACTDRGGGLAAEGTSVRAQNSIIYGNFCTSISATTSNTYLTTPSNLTNSWVTDPKYVDSLNSDYRLQSNSPCINAGNNMFTSGSIDLNSNIRNVGGTVDIGAYEFQSPASVLSYAWAQQYNIPTDGSADFTDSDSDGMNNYGEWRTDTIPNNTLSALKMVNATNSPTGAKVTWQSVATRNYWLERATNLGAGLQFQIIATNITGAAGVRTYTDTTATNSSLYLYRVGVQ